MIRARRARPLATAALLAVLLTSSLGARPARAQSAAEAGWGIGAALSSVVYAPLKIAYATAGLVFGGIGWGLSGGDPGVFETVLAPAVRGDYVVTPAHLRGERELVFVGGSGPARAAYPNDRDDRALAEREALDAAYDAYYDE